MHIFNLRSGSIFVSLCNKLHSGGQGETKTILAVAVRENVWEPLKLGLILACENSRFSSLLAAGDVSRNVPSDEELGETTVFAGQPDLRLAHLHCTYLLCHVTDRSILIDRFM